MHNCKQKRLNKQLFNYAQLKTATRTANLDNKRFNKFTIYKIEHNFPTLNCFTYNDAHHHFLKYFSFLLNQAVYLQNCMLVQRAKNTRQTNTIKNITPIKNETYSITVALIKSRDYCEATFAIGFVSYVLLVMFVCLVSLRRSLSDYNFFC